MSTTLSIRIDEETKKRLDRLAKTSKRSRAYLAGEAITAYVEAERWQVEQIRQGMAELDEGRGIPHEKIVATFEARRVKRPRTPRRA